MPWRIINNTTSKGVESHETPKAAQRAMLILSAHDIKNGRKADYRIEPQIIIPNTIDELDLPSWAYQVLVGDTPKKVGYWRRGEMYPELPDVRDFIDPSWDEKERTIVFDYVTDKTFVGDCYRGMSVCRCCGEWNGSADFTDGTYVWPEGLGHYILEHNVKPPQGFIDHVLAKTKKEPSDGARRAALRDPNYENMSAREQWEEDKSLGILDWDGD